MSAVTEEDTSEAVSHPAHGVTPQLEFGTFTVPTGMSSANIQVWGAGGNGQGTGPLGRDYRNGGGGGYAGYLPGSSIPAPALTIGKGNPGGSGGGGGSTGQNSASLPGGSGNTPPVSPPQGNNGGSTCASSPDFPAASGGGGATAA